MTDRGRVTIADGDVDTAVVAAFERSRRDLLRRGIAIGGAALAAATVPTLLGVRDAFAAAEDDGAILRAAVDLEQKAAFAYATVAGGGVLDQRVKAVARRFGAQETEHADALSTALGGFGGGPPAKPASGRDVKGLDGLKSQRAVLRFAVELEQMAIAAYYDAHRKLRDARLLQTAASIMADEGQHLVVLRQALGQDPVPTAFPHGRGRA